MNLSVPISYPEGTTEMQRIESEEFRQMITTSLLASELHMDKPNTAVRNACAHMAKRFVGERSRKIALAAASQALPMTYIKKLVKLIEVEHETSR